MHQLALAWFVIIKKTLKIMIGFFSQRWYTLDMAGEIKTVLSVGHLCNQEQPRKGALPSDIIKYFIWGVRVKTSTLIGFQVQLIIIKAKVGPMFSFDCSALLLLATLVKLKIWAVESWRSVLRHRKVYVFWGNIWSIWPNSGTHRTWVDHYFYASYSIMFWDTYISDL